MANEITITTSVTCRNGLLNVTYPAITKQYNQTTARGGGPGSVDVGTSEENIDFGDIVPGYVRLINTDATNFVRIRFSASDNAIRLLANGGMALFYLDASVTIIAIADTGACRVTIEAVNS